MKHIPLSAQARDTGKKPSNLRTENNVPCVLYGNAVANTSLQCDHNTLYKAYTLAGESTIVDLDANGSKIPVLFHSIDFHPVTEKILHADFYAVDMKKEIEASIPVNFEGTPPAVKELGGMLLTVMDHVDVRCLPANLPHNLTVDVSGLVEFDQSVSVADIIVPEGVEILEEKEMIIASIQQPRRSLEEEDAEAAAAAESASSEDDTANGDAEKEKSDS